MTRFFEYVQESFDSLLRNKTRSILTMLGMLIGVMAVISVYGLSVGAATGINDSISAGDAPGLTVSPDRKATNPAESQMHYRDARIIAAAAGAAVRRVVPYYARFSFGGGGYEVRYGNKKLNSGSFSWYGDDGDFKVLAGRAFTVADVEGAARVCIISHDLAFQLYQSDQGAVGQFLNVNGSRFSIVGVADPDNGTASNYFGGRFYFVLPYTTYHNFAPGPVDGIYLWPTDPTQENAAKTAALDALRRTHGEGAQFTVQSNRERLQTTKKVIDTIAAGLTAIGAISLFVAGVGIMNIMLVSVTERTREIGIRKSIGAKRGDVVLQFLIEAALISIVGGAIGLLVSLLIIVAASGVLARFLHAPIPVPFGSAVALSVVFSLGVGITFGVYPALRASTLDPVEALRT